MTDRSFLDDVAAQPDALRSIAARFGATDTAFAKWAAEWRELGSPPIVLTGMGASLFALEGADVTLALAGIPSRVIATADLLSHEGRRLDDAFLVVASQSGESTEVKDLLARVDPRRVHAVTNDPASTLGRTSGATVALGVRTDRSVAIVTYAASLAALTYFAAALAGRDPSGLTAQLHLIADEQERELESWRRQMTAAASAITRGRSMTVIGWGAGVGVAHESGLLFKEASRFPAEGMSADSLRHGAVELIDERHTTVVLVNRTEEGDQEDRSGHIAELVALAGNVIVVGEPPRDLSPRVMHVRTTERRTPLGGLADIVPLQLLAAGIATSAGFEPGEFRNTTPVIADRPRTSPQPVAAAGAA
jgi:glucosamine 6-phosphate synthetase-like amidotransferase/phosphosugar isomerase protein